MDDFYERVKALAKKQNLSLSGFLESLNISYETYKGQKRHNNLPRADEALKIAQELGTTVEYLVTGKLPEQDNHLKELQKEIEKLYRFSESL